MKIQTNQGECELTAEMVCRGMVFQDPKIGPYALVGYDHYAQAWITETKGTRTEAEVAIAHVFLGCDPAIASRADCERFGVHGDAAAHGFARLRGGGAVDLLREGEPRGSMFRCPGGGPPISPRCSMGRYEMVRQGQWIGLNAVEARPEDVERLCCGEYGPDQIDSGNRTTWVPRCTLAIGPHDEHEDLATGARWRDPEPVPGTPLTASYSAPPQEGRPKTAATWTYSGASAVTWTTESGFRFEDDGGYLRKGHAPQWCTLREVREAWAEQWERLRAAFPAHFSAGRSVGDPHPISGSLADERRLHDCPRCASGPRRTYCSVACGDAEQAARRAADRRQREAPLVALVNACPKGLDPVGWRAAVAAYFELARDSVAARLAVAPTLLPQLLRGDVVTGCHAHVVDAYQRALAPRAKVAPERKGMTWKTRGPKLPVDHGED